MALTGSDVFKIIGAIILPPLGVFLERGKFTIYVLSSKKRYLLSSIGCNVDLLINIGLTCLGFIPGISKLYLL